MVAAGQAGLTVLFTSAAVCWLGARWQQYQHGLRLGGFGTDSGPAAAASGKQLTTPFDGSLGKVSEVLGHVMRLGLIVVYVCSKACAAGGYLVSMWY